MKSIFSELLYKSTGASSFYEIEIIQSLWSGYGNIIRYGIESEIADAPQSVIVKHVKLPQEHNHPRGWNTDISHNRKVKSYKVETEWYQKFNHFCIDEACRTPHCLGIIKDNDEVFMVLEDLDDAGYPERRDHDFYNIVNKADIKCCISWLANFHAIFANKTPEALWENGTYWHLETRPEELEVLTNTKLKKAAPLINQKLKSAKYQSFVHGDAKLANFCFGKDSFGNTQVSAVDFQYVGGGCGMKDLAYFIGSCFDEAECERQEDFVLNFYFAELEKALIKYNPTIDAQDMIAEWRDLYYYAWADFDRFLKGWSPSHWKINSYSEKILRKVLKELL